MTLNIFEFIKREWLLHLANQLAFVINIDKLMCVKLRNILYFCVPQIPNPSKYRVDLRFFAELVAVGVFKEREGLPLLANQLGYLINNDKEEHNNLSILTSFCKHCGDDYAGLVPRKYR